MFKKVLILVVVLIVSAYCFWLFEKHYVHRFDRIFYRERIYHQSQGEKFERESMEQIKNVYNEEIISTGKYSKGAEIYVLKKSLNSKYVPVVIWTKNKDFTFKGYALSGGP